MACLLTNLMVNSTKEIISSASKSHRMLISQCYIEQASPGIFYYLPLGFRVMSKIKNILRQEMISLGACEVSLPTLASKELWSTVGRWEAMTQELYRLTDRSAHQMCLGPTHEEHAAQMVALRRGVSPKIFQISRKFRDEARPKHGLLRSREFEMKDLYSFDSTVEEANTFYGKVNESYGRIFHKLGLPYHRVAADSGVMGGTLSHEFLVPAEVGEEQIRVCSECNITQNLGEEKCRTCHVYLPPVHCIEVAHCFLLGDKYAPLIKNSIMGSYGVGVSRLMATCLEVSPGEDVSWPDPIRPFKVCLVTQKHGFMFEQMWDMLVDLERMVGQVPGLVGEVVVDDRHHLSIGYRLKELRRLGVASYAVVVNRRSVDDQHFELVDIKGEGSSQIVSLSQLMHSLTQL